MQKVEHFIELTRECRKGRPRKEKPHSEMFANFRVVGHAKEHESQKCGLVLKQGEICTGSLDAFNREKFGCENCRHFVRRW